MQKNEDMLLDRIAEFLDNVINSFKKEPQPLHIVINDPSGVVVAKRLSVDDLKRFMYDTSDIPGLCPYCHNTLEKIPNLEFRTQTRKDIVWTYDGFYIVSEKFKDFCEEQGLKELAFTPLKKSPGHYYFEPQGIFPIDEKNTIFEHEGDPCSHCGKYLWFGGPHRIYSKYHLTEDDNFIQRSEEFHGDKGRKFFLLIIGLKTERLMKEHGLVVDCTDDIHFLG